MNHTQGNVKDWNRVIISFLTGKILFFEEEELLSEGSAGQKRDSSVFSRIDDN